MGTKEIFPWTLYEGNIRDSQINLISHEEVILVNKLKKECSLVKSMTW